MKTMMTTFSHSVGQATVLLYMRLIVLARSSLAFLMLVAIQCIALFRLVLQLVSVVTVLLSVFSTSILSKTISTLEVAIWNQEIETYSMKQKIKAARA